MKRFLTLIVVLGIAGGSWFYISYRFFGRETEQPKPMVVTTTKLKEAKKPCTCCPERIEQIRERVRQRREAHEVWARGMLKLYGAIEGMKRIQARDPWMAKRIQRTLDSEKRLGLAPVVSQSLSQ